MSQSSQMFVAIRDDDKKLFNVIGPLTDDSLIIARVQAAQQAGRHVRCETGLYNTNQEMIEGGQMLGLRFDPDFEI